MSRAELLARLDSHELTDFHTLWRVRQVEREEREEEERLKRESDDGEVIAYGKPVREFDEDDEGEDEGHGSAE